MTQFLYITSASFSGSTLLTFLLNANQKIATIGELKGDSMDVESYCCSCGEPIGRCPFWTTIVARLNEAGIPFDLSNKWTQCGFRIQGARFSNRVFRTRVHGRVLEMCRDAYLALAPRCAGELAEIRKRNVAFVNAVTEVTGRPYFLDGSKDPTRLKFLLGIPEFAIKVIHLVRDGRGVMNSNMKRHQMGPELAAREWVTAQEEIGLVLRYVRPEAQMCVHYEDLCVDPRGVVGSILSFLNLPADDVNMVFRDCTHHIVGNAMRFESSSDIKLDTKWQRELSPEDLRVFEHLASRMNEKFGYNANV